MQWYACTGVHNITCRMITRLRSVEIIAKKNLKDQRVSCSLDSQCLNLRPTRNIVGWNYYRDEWRTTAPVYNGIPRPPVQNRRRWILATRKIHLWSTRTHVLSLERIKYDRCTVHTVWCSPIFIVVLRTRRTRLLSFLPHIFSKSGRSIPYVLS